MLLLAASAVAVAPATVDGPAPWTGPLPSAASSRGTLPNAWGAHGRRAFVVVAGHSSSADQTMGKFQVQVKSDDGELDSTEHEHNNVSKVFIVFSNHLDVGYTNSSAAGVVQKYWDHFFPAAMATAAEFREKHDEVSDRPCNVRREGGQSLVIGGPSLVILEGKACNPL